MDQTPLSFEFLDNKTYDTKDVRTVFVKQNWLGAGSTVSNPSDFGSCRWYSTVWAIVGLPWQKISIIDKSQSQAT
jgi:hypothetical protein